MNLTISKNYMFAAVQIHTKALDGSNVLLDLELQMSAVNLLYVVWHFCFIHSKS